MASIVNSRDLKLQATTPRFTPVRPQGIYLVESSDNFIVSEAGTVTPSDGIIYSLDIVGVTATADPVFTVVSGTATLSPVLEGTPPAANPKKAKLLFSDMLTNAVTIQASLTDTTGAVFTAEIRTIKIRESSVGVSVSTEGALFRVDGAGVGSPAVMEVYVAPKFLEFASSPVYTLTAVDSSGATIPGITLVPDAVKDRTWLLDYDEVAAAGVLSFGVKVSVTDKYSVTHTDTALLDVLVAGSSSVRVSSTSPFFVKPKTSSVLTPASITFTAVRQGVIEPVVWSILDQSGGSIPFTTGTDSNGNATATVTNLQFAAATLATITATAGTYSDTTTVQLVDEAVDGVFVAMANSLHEFDADAVGSIYSFTGSGSSFTIYEGATQVTTYDTSAPYAARSYRFGTPTVVTDSGSLSTPSFSGGALNNYSSMSANTATVTIPVIVTKQDGTAITVNVSQTLVKKKRGAVLSLSSTASSFAYTEAGTTPAPTSATITALVSNISPTLTTWYSSITVGAGAESARTANTGSTKTYTYTPQAVYSNMPQTVTIKVYDAASGGNLIATASIGMGATRVGDSGTDGRTYALAVAGGTRSFTYNAAGTASSPVSSSAFTAVLTLDGATVSPSSYSWSATGRLSGTSTSASFTPAVNQSYVADSTSVTLTVTHGSPAVSTTVTVPVAIAKVGDTGTNAVNGSLTKESYPIPSLQDGTGYTSYLSSAGGTFKVSFGTTDVTTSSTFSIVGGTDAGTTWTKVQNGLTFAINETTGVYSLSGASWTTDSESFTVTATYNGSTVTKIYTITKAKQGLPGKKTVVAKLFKWDTSASVPTADSSYNWSTNTLSLGSVTGWSTTAPSSTASGQKLYELSKLLIVDSDYTGTSTVDWNTSDVVGPIGVINEIGIRQDGSIGPTGPRGQSGYVYYTLESSTAPTPTPTATAFNFDTGAFTGLSADWATTYSMPSPTATTTNEKYWSSRYVVTEATYGGTQTITFSAPFVHTNFDGLVTFTNLNNGTDGTGAGTTFIDGGVIKTNTVKADAILTTSLSAIESNLGTVTVADAGHMRSGKTSSTDATNAGFFLGYNSPTYVFFIGNAGDTVSLKYDGNLTLKGGTVNVGTTGAVYGGQTAYDTGRGFFLGYSAGTQKLSIGCQSFTVTANPSTDIFTSAAFCALYPNNSAVCISNLGSTSGLRQGRWYYVINNNGTTFQLATTQGGSATAFGGSVSSVVLGGASLTYDGSNIDFNGENITAGRFRTSKNYSGPRVDIIGHSSTIEIWEESADGSTVSDNIRFGAGQAVRASTWDVLTNTTALVELSNSSTIGHQGRTLQVNNNYSGTEGTYTEAAYFYGNKARALRTEGLYTGTTASVSFYNAASGTTSYTVNSSTGVAAHIATTGTSGTSDTLKVENAALGKTASFTSSNASNSASVVYATTSGSGKVVEAVSNTAANATAVLTNNNVNGLALNANGAIAAANNSTTVSTVKAVNNASGGIAVEAVGRIDASGNIRVTGSSAPAAGQGLEFAYTGGIGYIQAYNRATSAYTGLYVSGNSVTINGSGDGSKGRLGVGTASFGTNAQNVLAIANGTAPISSPSGVGQIYVEDGALKFRGSSGTVTVLAPA